MSDEQVAILRRVSEAVNPVLPPKAGAFVMVILPDDGGAVELCGYAGATRERVVRGLVNFLSREPDMIAMLMAEAEAEDEEPS